MTTSALVMTIRAILLRELRAVRREIEAYPDQAALWTVPPGIGNSAGNLALHLAGNLRHFIGARLGDTGYVRNRDAEFARRNVDRGEILEELDAARSAIEQAFDGLTDATLTAAYPEQIAKATVRTDEWLVHLVAHLGYHLGQIDYHRRIVTGDARTLDTVSVRELPSTSGATTT
jgi:uncharacterized damage-inducible protein DinB